MNIKKQLQQARYDFQQLIKQGSLPPKMQTKLYYLQASITGQPVPPKFIDSLPQFQKMSLQMMNKQTKISLFNSIVRCLAGREVTIFFQIEKGSIKIQNSSSKSINCYISCDSNSLTISRNKQSNDLLHIFLLDKLIVANIYQTQKKKFLFGFAYQNVKYQLKFQQEGTCARIHAALIVAIKEKKSFIARKQEDTNRYTAMRSGIEQQQPWYKTGEQRILSQQRDYLLSLAKRIENVELAHSDQFQLIRNTDTGKIMLNRQKNIVKVMMFSQKCTVEGLIQSYIQFGAWNVQIESFQILKRIRSNTFLARLRLKKKNMFMAAREGYFTITYFKFCHCLRQNSQHSQDQSKTQPKHYLILTKTQPTESCPSGAVPMSFNQTIQFSSVQNKPGTVFVNLISSIDFNVYSYLQNSIDLNLQFIEEVASVAVLCRQREMVNTNRRELFNFNVCVCDRQKKNTNFLEFQSGNLKQDNGSEFSSASKNLLEEPISPHTLSIKQITKTISENNNLLIVQQIVPIIEKKLFQTYYLKQPFSQQLNQQPYISSDYHLNERVNFLALGSRWKFTLNEDFVFIDQQQLKLQKGVLRLIVKQITSNLMAGKSIMNMSLPVQLFDDFSALQSFSNIFGFIPYYLKEALKQKTVQEQIKYISIAFMCMFSCNPKVSKPFNPILGETFQGSIGGIPLYMEQISHHPPISTFFMKTDQFEIHGHFEIIVDLGLNSASSKFPGPLKVKIYSNNTQYITRLPEIQVSGLMFGDRTLKTSGKAFTLQKSTNTYLQYSIGKQRKKLYEYSTKLKGPDLAGGVFKVTNQAAERMLNLQKKKSYDGIKPQDAIQRYSLITGKWYGDVFFDGISYKSVKNGPFPLDIERDTILLPSDCTFRLDIVYRRWRNFKKSNQEKQVLQNLQRKDKKLRERYGPQH